jgi:NADH:ubiquinone oxidoreductase subunit 3 (subunit A)
MMTVLLMIVALSAVAGVMYRMAMSLRTVRFKEEVYFRRVVGALAVLAILLPGLAYAHGTVAMEEDPCAQRVGGNLVHFNAYQPQNEAKAQYCTEIPGEGDTFLVVDLVDAGLRHTPVGVRVVRGLSETTEGETVAYWPPATHPDGVVRGEARLAKGLYKLIISPEGFSPSSYLLRVQQVDYAKMGRQAMGPLVAFLVLALIGYEFSKSKRFMRWRAAGNS